MIDLNSIGPNALNLDGYRNIPSISNRLFWNNINRRVKDKIISEAKQYLNYNYPSLKATQYLDYIRKGIRSSYQWEFYKRRTVLGKLVLAECLEDNGIYIDDIINGIWCICEEISWTVPSCNDLFRNDKRRDLPTDDEFIIDLFSAETGGLMAGVFALVKDKLDEQSPEICRMLEKKVREKIIEPYMEYSHFWWMGFNANKQAPNNWNPWIHSNLIRTGMTFIKEESQKKKFIIKCLRSLNKFIEVYGEDGGCDEGPVYWNQASGALFECLEQISQLTSQQLGFFDEPLIKAMGSYIANMHINDKWYVNFADSAARVEISSDMVFRYGKAIGNEKMMSLAASSHSVSNLLLPGELWFPIARIISNIANFNEIRSYDTEYKPQLNHYFSDIEVMISREQASHNEGLYLAAKGGSNDESHNHNDIGNLIVYYNGSPVIVDVGVGDYTTKTFGPERYTIWTMQSGYHNVPIINGNEQKYGTAYRAKKCSCKLSDSLDIFTLDIADAYDSIAGVLKWNRTIQMDRTEKVVQINEEYKLKKSSDVSINFILSSEPSIDEAGNITLYSLDGNGLTFDYDNTLFEVTCQCVLIDPQNQKLSASWDSDIYKLVLKTKEKKQGGNLNFKIQSK